MVDMMGGASAARSALNLCLMETGIGSPDVDGRVSKKARSEGVAARLLWRSPVRTGVRLDCCEGGRGIE